jgi:hypothetical protein
MVNPNTKEMTTLDDPLDIFSDEVEINGPSDDQVGEDARQTAHEFEIETPDTSANDVEVEIDDEDEGEVDATPEPVVEEPVKAEPTPEEIEVAAKEAERKSRASERIRELNNEAKAAKSEAEQAKKAAFESQLNTVRLTKTMVESHIQASTKALKDALDTGDSELVAKSMQELNKQTNDLAKLDAYLESNKEFKSDTTTSKPTTGMNEAQANWFEGKQNWVDTANYGKLPMDERRVVLPMRNWARELGNRLVQEGFDPTDQMFFEELDLRMEEKFGEDYKTLAEKGPSVLLSMKNTKSSSGETLNTPDKKSASSSSDGSQKSKSPQQKAQGLPIATPSVNAGQYSEGQVRAKRSMKFSDLPPESQRAYELGASSSMTKEQYVKRYMQEIAKD